jgi:hypothetical protein
MKGKILPLPVIDMKYLKIIVQVSEFFKAIHKTSPFVPLWLPRQVLTP